VRAILALIAIGILAMGGLAGMQAGLENAGTDNVVTNETWTPDAGNVTTLEESNRSGAYYGDNVTVYDENGTQMDLGEDYEWYVGNGTVKALVGGDLDGDSEATITYSYQQTTKEQRDLTAMAGQVPRAFGYFVLFVPLLLLIKLVT
jgi:hypothetical protein